MSAGGSLGGEIIESIALVDPRSGQKLVADQKWSLTDGQTRWPVVAGIPYVRVGRDSLRLAALEALDAGDDQRALVLLLGDQDDYARIAPPAEAERYELVAAVAAQQVTLRSAMMALRYGPVADYFAFRWSSPTYLSGLTLLDGVITDPNTQPIVEVACGIGHYLRDLARRGRRTVGLDVVFSKLWLARQFVVPADVALICGDAVAGWPIGPIPGGAIAFCHDAFYFLPRKPEVVASLRHLVGAEGTILIGHAHNRNFDHGGVAGEPKTPQEYADLLPGCTLFDDAELARSGWLGEPAQARSLAELEHVEAIALVSGISFEGVSRPVPTLFDTVPGCSLRLNPLLKERAGRLEPDWPSARFAAEYASASSYLSGEPTPSQALRDAASRGDFEQEPSLRRLVRRRIFLDLPERW